MIPDWLMPFIQAVLTTDLVWSLLGTVAAFQVIKIITCRFVNPLEKQEIYWWSFLVAYPIVHNIYRNPPISVLIIALIVGVLGNLAYAWLYKVPMRKYLPELYRTLNGDRRHNGAKHRGPERRGKGKKR